MYIYIYKYNFYPYPLPPLGFQTVSCQRQRFSNKDCLFLNKTNGMKRTISS